MKKTAPARPPENRPPAGRTTSAHSRATAGKPRLLAESAPAASPADSRRFSGQDDTQRLYQELQVHQIELELQNEELKHAKGEAETLLERYTDLYDFAPVGYFNLAANGCIRLVNLAGASMFAIERANLAGRSFATLVTPPFRPALKQFLAEVFSDRTKHSADFEIINGTDAIRTVNIEAKRLFNGLECRIVVVDITERKRGADILRASEARYRRLFEAAHDGVLLLDPATSKITDANPFMTKLLDYPYARLVGMRFHEIGLLKDEAASKAMFKKLKKDHSVRYDHLPLASRRGRRQHVEVVANLYQENGRPVIQCNIRDITERKRAEDILRRNEALFSALIEQAPVGVYVVDDKFRLQQVNPRALTLFRNVGPLAGRDFSEIVRLLWSRKFADPVLASFNTTLETGVPHQSPEFKGRRRDTGALEIYDWQIKRVTLPSGEFGVVCFFNDITERIRNEQARRTLDVLTASNAKLKKEIVRRQAVELSLTTSERRALELLRQARELQEKLRHLSHRILLVQEEQRKKISRELHDDISQLLVGIIVHVANFTKAATVDPASIRKNLTPLRLLVEKSVRVVHRFARELRPTMLDDLGLIPALQSYVDEFPKHGGRRVEFTAFDDDEFLDNDRRTVLYRVAQEALVNVSKHACATRVKVILRQSADDVTLEIADNGRAFDVSLLSSAGWKDHLGLVGMRERVEMVGGRFDIVSTRGKGTTITATVPAFRERRKKKLK